MNRTIASIRRGAAALALALALAGGVASMAPTSVDAQASAQEAPTGVVNINTASAEQLALLPGVGPSRAQAIVAQRERREFRRVEEIMRVRGIGRATFRRLSPMLTVEGETTLTAPTRRSRSRSAD